MRRRSLLGGTLGLAGLAAFGGGLRLGPAAARAQDAALPDDAAPADQQVFVVPSGTQPDKTPDFYESVYERLSDGSSDIFSDPLVRLNRNFEIIPAAALEWSGNEDGTVWTFDLDPALMWNDGNPVTANDWVRDLPVRRRPGPRLGLHLVLPGGHGGVGRGDRRRDPARRARRAPGRKRASS